MQYLALVISISTVFSCATHPSDAQVEAQGQSAPGLAFMDASEPAPAGPLARNDEPFQDLNRNGVEDTWDISDGTSLDENLNGIPDEAEEPARHAEPFPGTQNRKSAAPRALPKKGPAFQDWNGNGVDDTWDIVLGDSLDVDLDGIPDEVQGSADAKR